MAPSVLLCLAHLGKLRMHVARGGGPLPCSSSGRTQSRCPLPPPHGGHLSSADSPWAFSLEGQSWGGLAVLQAPARLWPLSAPRTTPAETLLVCGPGMLAEPPLRAFPLA